MTRRILIVLTALTLATSLASADDHGNNSTPLTPVQQIAKKVARLTVQLTLTTTQQAQATTIFTTEQTAEAALVTPKQTAQTALQAAILANSTADIQAQALALGRLQEQSIVADATAQAAFYAILTAPQQATYNTRRTAELNDNDGN